MIVQRDASSEVPVHPAELKSDELAGPLFAENPISPQTFTSTQAPLQHLPYSISPVDL